MIYQKYTEMLFFFIIFTIFIIFYILHATAILILKLFLRQFAMFDAIHVSRMLKCL